MGMSETGVTAVFLLMLAAARPWLDRDRPGAGWWRGAALGLLLGWLTLTKAPFAYWAVALTCRMIARAMRGARWGAPLACIAAGAACLAADLAWRQWAYGDWRMNGYRYWAPAIYGELGRVFNPRFLTQPWLSSYDHGNLGYYRAMLLGRTDDFYNRTMPLVCAVAAIGLAWPWRRGRPTGTATLLAAGWLAVGAAFCGLYFFQSTRFPFLWMPVLDGLAAWGLVRMPFWKPLRQRRILGLRLSTLGQVVALLALLVLLRGGVLRIHGYFHRADHVYRQRPAMTDTVRSRLDQVPADGWLLTNWHLPLVQLWRANSPGRSVALEVDVIDAFLMNPHVYSIWSYGLQPKLRIGQRARNGSFVPDGLLIDPLTGQLPPADVLRARMDDKGYLLVATPSFFPVTGERFEEKIRPKLEALWRLEPIQTGDDVTLYRLAWKRPAGGQTTPKQSDRGAGTAPVPMAR
jgi:hypothetical protein